MVRGGYAEGGRCLSRKLVSETILVRKEFKKKNPLTDTRNQIVESFLRKEGVFQPTEIQLQNASNGVNIMVTLVISQRVFTYIKKTSVTCTVLLFLPLNKDIFLYSHMFLYIHVSFNFAL